jgi:hypothetical protein
MDFWYDFYVISTKNIIKGGIHKLIHLAIYKTLGLLG